MNLNFANANPAEPAEDCNSFIKDFLAERTLIVASNRGPITFHKDEAGNLQYQRGSGGLVTALTGVAQHAEVQWIAAPPAGEPPRPWR